MYQTIEIVFHPISNPRSLKKKTGLRPLFFNSLLGGWKRIEHFSSYLIDNVSELVRATQYESRTPTDEQTQFYYKPCYEYLHRACSLNNCVLCHPSTLKFQLVFVELVVYTMCITQEKYDIDERLAQATFEAFVAVSLLPWYSFHFNL